MNGWNRHRDRENNNTQAMLLGVRVDDDDDEQTQTWGIGRERGSRDGYGANSNESEPIIDIGNLSVLWSGKSKGKVVWCHSHPWCFVLLHLGVRKSMSNLYVTSLLEYDNIFVFLLDRSLYSCTMMDLSILCVKCVNLNCLVGTYKVHISHHMSN